MFSVLCCNSDFYELIAVQLKLWQTEDKYSLNYVYYNISSRK